MFSEVSLVNERLIAGAALCDKIKVGFFKGLSSRLLYLMFFFQLLNFGVDKVFLYLIFPGYFFKDSILLLVLLAIVN